MKFSQTEGGGAAIFLLLPRGDQQFNRVFHPISTTHPRELKDVNSLVVGGGGRRANSSQLSFAV